MDYNVDDIIKFNNGEYLVLNVIKNKENTYLYLINNDEYLNDVSIVKVISDGINISYDNIDNDKEFDYVLNKLFIEYEDDILDLATNE